MGLYKGWRGGGGFVPQSSLDPCMHEDYAFVCVSVEFLCLAISLSVYLSLSICLSFCMSLFLPLSLPLPPPPRSLSLSICGVDLADQGSELDTGQFKSLVGTLNQSRPRLTLAGRSLLS